MKKDSFGVAVLLSIGAIIGMSVQAVYDQRKIKAVYKDYTDELERANGLVQKCNQLDLDLRQCRLTNWQVGQYATQLKKQLDHFME